MVDYSRMKTLRYSVMTTHRENKYRKESSYKATKEDK